MQKNTMSIINLEPNVINLKKDELNLYSFENIKLIEVNKAGIIKDKETLFQSLKKEIPLNDLLSYSWDALDECLNLDTYNKHTIIIAYNMGDYIANNPDDFNNLKNIFNSVSKQVKEDYKKTYKLIVVDSN